MGRYDGISDVRELASAYGDDMRRFGSSQEWNSPQRYPDTTTELQSSPLYSRLSLKERNLLLGYGFDMKRYGMGCYMQEDNACTRLYDKYFLQGGVPNPFDQKEQEPEQPGGPQ